MAMEIASMCTSQSLSVCNIYIHRQSFKQKKSICNTLNKKDVYPLQIKRPLNFDK